MPAFLNRVFKRDAASKKLAEQNAADLVPQKPKWEDGWARTEVAPDEVQELLRGCTHEVKSRGLSTPFLLLPYRPNSDTSPARSFIRSYFNPTSVPPSGAQLQQELRLTEPDVLCSALKWCWSRLPGGVVTWDVYELFRQGEVDSSMARDAFATFIPISAESEARSKIIFDYFDLLSAIAAHGKHNGLGGLKLSRLAGWWAFEHNDTGFGFEGGYASWTSAADATCHLFFAYLRSLSPADPTRSVSLLPTSLRALLASVDYPPVTPPQLQNRSVRVCLTVDKVAPSPFALLRRARHHQYHPGNSALRIFCDYEDPVRGLTDECKRVLKCISSSSSTSKTTAGLQEQSWSRFQDMGFSGLLQEGEEEPESDEDGLPSQKFKRREEGTEITPLTPPKDLGIEIARPTTPSWADFMDGGFGDREIKNAPAPLLLPPDKVLPPIETQERTIKTSQSEKKVAEYLEPGDLESVAPIDIDDAFWWVWMSSLAGEETSGRKAVFGRCALVETNVKGSKWLVVEEKVRGAATLEESPLLKKEKKRSKLSTRFRRRSLNSRTETPVPQPMKQFNPSLPAMNRSNIGPDQTAKIQAAAAALRQQHADEQFRKTGRPREDKPAGRTHSVFTLQPVIMSEATPAMKWANRYDRDSLRDEYLKGTPAPEKKSDQDRPAPPPKDLPPAPSRSETPAPAPAVQSDATVLRPASPKNRPTTMFPSSNGRSSPAPEKRLSLNAGNTQPNNSTNPLPVEKSPKVSRLRALFGGGKGDRSAHLGVPASPSRKLSQRKKHAPIEWNAPAPAPAAPSVADTEAASVHEPVIEADAFDDRREQEAQTAFNAFDQGPLNTPAFVADDSPDMRDSLEFNKRPDVLARDDDEVSEPSPPNSPAVQDRWAQIRKNAAERAKTAPKVSDDFSATDATRTSLDDGETSGEETIESRVARIKARVAELTGNDTARI